MGNGVEIQGKEEVRVTIRQRERTHYVRGMASVWLEAQNEGISGDKDECLTGGAERSTNESIRLHVTRERSH